MRTVVVVEDDSRLRKALGLRFAELGYRFVPVDGAMNAMSKIANARPDVVVLDISLPGSNGFVVSDRLRSNFRFADMPIIFISGQTSGIDNETLAALRATYLPKPFRFDQLVSAIDESIGCRRSR